MTAPIGAKEATQGTTAASSVKPPDDLGGFKSTEFDPLIRQASEKYGVPARLIKAVINQESGFKPTAHSKAGAAGLMQLMPGTARELGVKNPMDPAQSIEGGTKYLAGMLQKFGGNVELALAAYNAGPGNVAKAGNRIPPFRETQNYVRNIMSSYHGTAQVDVPSVDTMSGRKGQPLAHRTGAAAGGTYPPVSEESPYAFFEKPPKTNRIGFMPLPHSSREQMLELLLKMLREECPELAALSDEQLLGLARATNPEVDAVLNGTSEGALLTMPEAGVVVPPGATRDDIEAAIVKAARESPGAEDFSKLSDKRLLSNLLLLNPTLKSALKVRPVNGAVLPLYIGAGAALQPKPWAAPTTGAIWNRPHHG